MADSIKGGNFNGGANEQLGGKIVEFIRVLNYIAPSIPVELPSTQTFTLTGILYDRRAEFTASMFFIKVEEIACRTRIQHTPVGVLDRISPRLPVSIAYNTTTGVITATTAVTDWWGNLIITTHLSYSIYLIKEV